MTKSYNQVSIDNQLHPGNYADMKTANLGFEIYFKPQWRPKLY